MSISYEAVFIFRYNTTSPLEVQCGHAILVSTERFVQCRLMKQLKHHILMISSYSINPFAFHVGS